MARRSFLSAFAGLSLLAAPLGMTGYAVCLGVGSIVVGLTAACNTTPTLPLPPPLINVGTPNTQGLITVRGEVLPLAYVSVFNERTETGLIVRADRAGDFEIEIEAEVGDLISVWSEIDGELSERKHANVPPPR